MRKSAARPWSRHCTTEASGKKLGKYSTREVQLEIPLATLSYRVSFRVYVDSTRSHNLVEDDNEDYAYDYSHRQIMLSARQRVVR